MVALNPLARQPSNIDFARTTQFKFSLLKIPNVEYFTFGANLPGISFTGDAEVNSRFKSIAMIGDTLDYEDLNIEFLVNEDLSNYREIHDWMTGMGFPEKTPQFTEALKENTSTATSGDTTSTLTSDATLTILTNKNNPKVNVRFRNCYPKALSALTFNAQTTDAEQLTASVTFKYDLYEFEIL